MRKNKKLLDEYRFPGFRPRAAVKGRFGDNKARIIELTRRQKKLFAGVAEPSIRVFTTERIELSGICPAGTRGYMYQWKRGASTV